MGLNQKQLLKKSLNHVLNHVLYLIFILTVNSFKFQFWLPQNQGSRFNQKPTKYLPLLFISNYFLPISITNHFDIPFCHTLQMFQNSLLYIKFETYMTSNIIVLIVCSTLLFSVDSAVVNITCSTSSNSDCTSGFEYKAVSEGFDDQTYCAPVECEDGVTVTTHIADCTKDWVGLDCSSKRCVANQYLGCLSAQTACANQTVIKYTCAQSCPECTGVCTSAEVEGIKVNACVNQVDTCIVPSYDATIENCESTTAGTKCKCCSGVRFNVPGNQWTTGYCTSSFNWDSDDLDKIAAWNPRELSQLVLLLIAGLFVTLNF